MGCQEGYQIERYVGLTKSTYILKGAELASATVPWHWLFFAPPWKSVHIIGCSEKKNLESLKWHWLILPSIGASVHTKRKYWCKFLFCYICIRAYDGSLCGNSRSLDNPGCWRIFSWNSWLHWPSLLFGHKNKRMVHKTLVKIEIW